MNIKKELLTKHLVVENKYLNLYVSLIQKNLKQLKISGKTQKHHIIPRYYYRDNALLLNSSRANVVNLSYTDHMLAHYYLALCASNQLFRYYNECALFRLGYHGRVKNNSLYAFKQTYLDNLEKYKELYAERIKIQSERSIGRKYSEEWKAKISKKLTGLKRGPFSLEHRKKLSEAAKKRGGTTTGRISIYNTELKKKKYIPAESVRTYITQGWIKGGVPQTEEAKKSIGEHTSRALKGGTRSEEAKRKTSETMKEHWKNERYRWKDKLNDE